MEFPTITDLHNYWHEHNACGLRASATQPVYGNGNPESRIVFIGEAPGADEDRDGVPFIGRAGKFLNEMLADIKLKREDVYITNTVKYRPPDNRDPLPDEIEACRQWLWEEMNFIKPLVIVTLGRYAMNYFLPEAKISNVHGKLVKKHIAGLSTYYFYPLYHPAAALYNGSMRGTLEEDMKKLPKILTDLQNI